MGCVYLAEHIAIHRPLALKLLHPEVEGIDGISERFQREAFAIGRVDHPNCVNVSDFGQLEDGTLYMVLEVLDGVPLFDLLDTEHRLGWRRALHIARHVLSALAYAHDAGIVHRDVKPENVILVEQDGDRDFAKILDFGIAKLFDDAHVEAGVTGLTQLGVTIGTPTYIAPEQAFGQAVDARADLYALSIMLFEMIAGAPPFEAEVVIALLTMHATADVPRFCDVAPDVRVPPGVEAMIRRGLEKKQEDRIQSAVEYIAQIDEALSRESLVPGFPPSQPGGEGPDRPSWVEGVRAKAEDVHRSLAPVVARAVTKVRAIPKHRSRKEILGVSAGVVALLSVLLVAFGSSGPLDSYILDLKQGDSCAERKAAVAKLRALGDKRAIPALEEAQTRTRTVGLFRRKANANRCLRTDAEEAVQYLESL
ncbi:MAG: serine/threonine protein kinase [Deltaproteobacteria bacterium]|nr:serine/threonine protein kinase [Deltaproteobacteria bacterium]MBW2402374.1 serine/threonine protein kinase [Deltaproteobacteria bacterium]MBW2717381.1 serine/threonine protein kinase [Deltaproteobacteria bacterium]